MKTKAFFIELGLKLEGESTVEGPLPIQPGAVGDSLTSFEGVIEPYALEDKLSNPSIAMSRRDYRVGTDYFY